MYNVLDYGAMIRDKVRMDPYVQALRKSINFNSVVLDIGTGTGIFAVLACKFGARKVYAIEPNEAIQLAQEIANTNGYADRITFIENVSNRVSLSEQVDVIISDLRGVLPLSNNHIMTIADARTRFLQPDGILIPCKDSLWAAIVNAPELYSATVEVWTADTYGVDLTAGMRHVLNTWNRGSVRPEQMLASPQRWAELDYATITDSDISGSLSWNVDTEGLAHGIVVWFDTILSEGVGFSNAPGTGADVYGSAFFPWSEPVALRQGDKVDIQIRAAFVEDDYIWNWDTKVSRSCAADVNLAQFRQSTFFARPISTSRLRRISETFVPRLNMEGKIDQLILAMMENAYSQGEIAAKILEQFPGKFSKVSEALTHVVKLSGKYSR